MQRRKVASDRSRIKTSEDYEVQLKEISASQSKRFRQTSPGRAGLITGVGEETTTPHAPSLRRSRCSIGAAGRFF
jgi:hypothetical protein